ncbi:MAG TPA: ABC transporter substrate-binding protein [Trueperaceae bacterium]|nr:ABC transporter substrate-binding protein [Trueperaceae bacterium]
MKRILMLVAVAALGATMAFAQSAKDTYVWQTFGGVDTLDGAMAYDTSSGTILENVYEPLMGYQGDKVDQYAPRLATGYTVSQDGKTVTYDLRKGVKFQSGNDFTCKDVAYTIKRDLVTNNPASAIWFLAQSFLGDAGNADSVLKNKDATQAFRDAHADEYHQYFQKIDSAVTCSDDYTAVMHLDSADPAFVAKMAFPAAYPIDSKWAMDNGTWDGTEATWEQHIGQDGHNTYLNDHASGTGAYQLVQWTPGQRVVLKANDSYWGGAPAIKNVLYQIVDDQNARILALKNGDADRINLGSLSALSQVEGLSGVKVYNRNGDLGWSSVNVDGVSMNEAIKADNNPSIGSGKLDGQGIPADFFTDVHVRRCFAYAFDYQAYIQQVLLGLGSRINFLLPPSFLGYDTNVPEYSLDLDKATSECKQAWDGKLWTSGMKLTISYNTGNLQRKTVADILKSNLEYINPKFNIEVRGIAWPDFLAAQRAKELPVYVSGWAPDYADPDNYVTTYYDGGNGYYASYESFNNAQIEQLVRQAASERDPQARKLLYSQVAHQAHDLAPYINLPQQRPLIIARSDLKGVYLNPMYSGQFLWKDISK